MADERCDVAVCDRKLNGSVDEIREECYALLEKAGGNIHDARGELNDGDLRGGFHLTDCIEEAISRYTCVRVDDQNIVSNSDISLGPGSSLVFLDGL